MKVSNLVGSRFKEKPADCVIDSHALMVRGGYMKYVGNGIYSELPILRRITRKIENIIREEMDAIGGQEVLFPVVMPGDLWRESGRYESVGKELVRLKDRNDADLVLGMTHEEAAVQLVREYASSYQNYPFMIYQIQRKFRDEARPRAGLIRVREFTMKDAYSFHTSKEDLQAYYQVCYDAYNRIFRRVGVPEVITVASDSGMMGGNLAHEYMLLTEVGEDSIVLCTACDYRANMEAAENIIHNGKDDRTKPAAAVTAGEDTKATTDTMAADSDFADEKNEIPVESENRREEDSEKKSGKETPEKVSTPDKKTIEDVCAYLGADVKSSCKAVVYQKNEDDTYVVVFLRGDLEVNETKLRNLIGAQIHAADVTAECGLVAGYIGPVGLDASAVKPGCAVVYDSSLSGLRGAVAGANEEGYHFTGVDFARDLADAEYHDVAKAVEGGICPCCGKPALTIKRGIEVGNIFQLDTKYTKSMGMQYTDENGTLQYPLMGCYGIGVGRLAASVCEARHDAYGPIWPISIAPYEVHICALRADDPEVRAAADTLYGELSSGGTEVLIDDRRVRPGVMFSDADLIGVPVRVIVSPKNLAEGVVELATRDKSVQKKVPVAEAAQEIRTLVEELYKNLKASKKNA